MIKKILGTIILVSAALLNFPTPSWSMSEKPVITDPDDPGFDTKEFRFENHYKEGGDAFELLAAMLKTFPPGTKKVFIEDILIKKNPVKRRATKNGEYTYLWHITFPAPEGKRKHGPILETAGEIVVIYDKNDRSTYLRFDDLRLYGNMTQFDKLVDNEIAENRKRYTPKAIEANEKHENKLKTLRKKYLGSPEGYLDDTNSNNHGERP